MNSQLTPERIAINNNQDPFRRTVNHNGVGAADHLRDGNQDPGWMQGFLDRQNQKKNAYKHDDGPGKVLQGQPTNPNAGNTGQVVDQQAPAPILTYADYMRDLWMRMSQPQQPQQQVDNGPGKVQLGGGDLGGRQSLNNGNSGQGSSGGGDGGGKQPGFPVVPTVPQEVPVIPPVVDPVVPTVPNTNLTYYQGGPGQSGGPINRTGTPFGDMGRIDPGMLDWLSYMASFASEGRNRMPEGNPYGV